MAKATRPIPFGVWPGHDTTALLAPTVMYCEYDVMRHHLPVPCDGAVCSCVQGQASDIAIHAEEIIKLKSLLNKLLAQHTGQPVEMIGRWGHIVSFQNPPGVGHLELGFSGVGT